MKRRTFLSTLATLPFVGALRPNAHAVDFRIIDSWWEYDGVRLKAGDMVTMPDGAVVRLGQPVVSSGDVSEL